MAENPLPSQSSINENTFYVLQCLVFHFLNYKISVFICLLQINPLIAPGIKGINHLFHRRKVNLQRRTLSSLFQILFVSFHFLAKLSYSMDTEEPAEPFQNSLYPYFMQYGQGIPLTGVNLDYIPSNMIPLIHQYQMEMAAKKEEEKQPMPSYKEVREELSDKLGNLSRKEKRKLIKNKRNRMKRQQIQVKEETVHENVYVIDNHKW